MNPTPVQEERPAEDLFEWSKRNALRVAEMKDRRKKLTEDLEEALAARDGTRQAKALEMANDALKARKKEVLDEDEEVVDLRGKTKELRKKLKETEQAVRAGTLADQVSGCEKEIAAVQSKIADVLAGRGRPIDDFLPGAEVGRDEAGNLRITVDAEKVSGRKDRERGRRRDLE